MKKKKYLYYIFKREKNGLMKIVMRNCVSLNYFRKRKVSLVFNSCGSKEWYDDTTRCIAGFLRVNSSRLGKRRRKKRGFLGGISISAPPLRSSELPRSTLFYSLFLSSSHLHVASLTRRCWQDLLVQRQRGRVEYKYKWLGIKSVDFVPRPLECLGTSSR